MPVLQFHKTPGKRSRVGGLRAEEFGDLIFLDHGSAKIGDKTLGFLIVLDGVTSHLTAYPCKSTSPSEVITELHEWMDTFQMNPKTICADTAFHQPHDMRACYRMHNVKRLPTRPHTPWPNRDEMCTIVQEVPLGTRGYSLQTPGPDHSGTNHSCPVDAQRSNGEKYTGDLKW